MKRETSLEIRCATAVVAITETAAITKSRNEPVIRIATFMIKTGNTTEVQNVSPFIRNEMTEIATTMLKEIATGSKATAKTGTVIDIVTVTESVTRSLTSMIFFMSLIEIGNKTRNETRKRNE